MNVRSRLLLGTFALTRSSVSNTTKPPTHYETLELNPRATQREIKSAYFKLSKQYHPDKNKNEEATTKFRNITEAYEVLGNFRTRKVYDRTMLIHTPHNVRRGTSIRDDPKVQYYQNQAALFRHYTKTGSVPAYNFDAWTKAHYGRTLKRYIIDKRDLAEHIRERNSDRADIMPLRYNLGYLVCVIAITSFITVLTIRSKKPIDYPTLTIRQRDELEKKNLESLKDSVFPK